MVKANTSVISERVLEVIRRCQNALSQRDDPFIEENTEALKTNLGRIADSFCGSCIGYHSRVYYRGLQTPAPGDHFSVEWGLMDTWGGPRSGNWIEYSPEQIQRAAFSGIAGDFQRRLKTISDTAKQTFEESRDTLLTIVSVLLDKEKTTTLERLRDEIKDTEILGSASKFAQAMMPRGQFMSRDSTAVTQGILVPPHIAIQAEQIAMLSPFGGLESLIKCGKSVLGYMEIHDMVDKDTVKKADRVFIGHGKSALWRELKDFLQDRLHLSWEEFNRESPAGHATVERLQAMLDNSCFAFLVMTAEDEHGDKTLHARENVIHEAGLFQGHLGFKKAIILLEEGCSEFANIEGLGEIRFPKGNISAAFEEVRRVLEREKII
jgi:predicted nucleotide-binding protein